MTQRVTDAHLTEMMTDQLHLVTALYNIAHDTTEHEIVRTAMAALMNTEAGRNYVALNPIVL